MEISMRHSEEFVSTASQNAKGTFNNITFNAQVMLNRTGTCARKEAPTPIHTPAHN